MAADIGRDSSTPWGYVKISVVLDQDRGYGKAPIRLFDAQGRRAEELMRRYSDSPTASRAFDLTR